MQQQLQKPDPPPFPSSPAGSNFIPRKEFTQAPLRQSSAFALLAFSSNNAIRLSNFAPSLVTALRSLLNAVIGLRSFRENTEHKLAEIILTGKPWSSPKSLSTEIVLVQVFNMLLAHGYGIVSQLDYGREHSDRLSLVFSRADSVSGESQPHPQPRFVAFALSFPSHTVLRVVCPPLHATPAILQSVRGAWPRGVNSEKKLGEGCYEFKLKGYSWFNEDTFPEDALTYILTILTALDRHGCKLLTSLALTASRPRNKDLWIFSAPSPDYTSSTDADVIPRTGSPVRLGSPLKPSTYEPIVDHAAEGSGDSEGAGFLEGHSDNKAHTRAVTVDVGRSGEAMRDGHMRSRSDTGPAGLLKKHPSETLAKDETIHASPTLHSPPLSHDIIPGPPPSNINYTSTQLNHLPPRGKTDTIHVSDLPQRFPVAHTLSESQPLIGIPPAHPLVSLPEPAERHPSDDDFPQQDFSADTHPHPANNSTPTLRGPELPTPPLLPSAAFRTPTSEARDSGFSVETGHSFDVPITWIPPAQPPHFAFRNDTQTEGDRSSITTGPLLPGGWAPTPALEADDSIAQEGAGIDATPRINPTEMPERQDALAPHSPEIVHPSLPEGDSDLAGQESLRRSEAGVLGVIPSPAPESLPPIPQVQPTNGHATGHTEKPKEGWVAASADGSAAPTSVPGESTSTSVQGSHTFAAASDQPASAQSPTTQVHLATSQIIATVDAAEGASPSSSPSGDQKSPSVFSRFLYRKGSDAQRMRSVGKQAGAEMSGRFRRKGGVLPTLRSGKRQSID